MTDPLGAPRIVVLAGTNGAGKSSIGGAALRHNEADYFNPDEAADRFAQLGPHLTRAQANIAAWTDGKRLLERAIAHRLDFSFETTLGGRTMTRLLERALDDGFEVWMWYAGLSSPELHIARVARRVAAGGHDIPERAIRQRYDDSRKNLIRLLPRLTKLLVFDNSDDADPISGIPPTPRLVLHTEAGRIVAPPDLSNTPGWAKPIVSAALKLQPS